MCRNGTTVRISVKFHTIEHFEKTHTSSFIIKISTRNGNECEKQTNDSVEELIKEEDTCDLRHKSSIIIVKRIGFDCVDKVP